MLYDQNGNCDWLKLSLLSCMYKVTIDCLIYHASITIHTVLFKVGFHTLWVKIVNFTDVVDERW